jgi:hypothetical protein
MAVGRGLALASLLATAVAWAEPTDSPLDAENFRGPLCFISGSVKPVNPAEANAFTGMIRLRFAADNLEECRQVVEAHCRFRWAKIGYVTDRIAGYYRPDLERDPKAKSKQVDFYLGKRCAAVLGRDPRVKN